MGGKRASLHRATRGPPVLCPVSVSGSCGDLELYFVQMLLLGEAEEKVQELSLYYFFQLCVILF